MCSKTCFCFISYLSYKFKKIRKPQIVQNIKTPKIPIWNCLNSSRNSNDALHVCVMTLRTVSRDPASLRSSCQRTSSCLSVLLCLGSMESCLRCLSAVFREHIERCCHHAALPAPGGCPLSDISFSGLQISLSPRPSL